MTLDLILKDMKDQLVRENFFRVQRFLASQTVLAPDFEFFEVDVNEPSLLFPIAHGLSYAPTDLILLSAKGDQNFYFRYDKFDKKNIYVASHGPVRLRFLLGRYQEQGKRQLAESDIPFIAPNISATSGGAISGSGSDGWAFLQDSAHTQGSPLNVSAGVLTRVPNDKAGPQTNYVNAPANAVSWWDAINSRFWPSFNGEFYTFRLNFTIVPSLNNKALVVSYDIGTANLPFEQTCMLAKGAGVPTRFSVPMPAPIGQAPFSNGIGFNIQVDCAAQVYGISLTIVRDFHK